MVSLIINKSVIFQNRLFAITCIIISVTYLLSLSERSQLYIQASDQLVKVTKHLKLIIRISCTDLWLLYQVF